MVQDESIYDAYVNVCLVYAGGECARSHLRAIFRVRVMDRQKKRKPAIEDDAVKFFLLLFWNKRKVEHRGRRNPHL